MQSRTEHVCRTSGRGDVCAPSRRKPQAADCGVLKVFPGAEKDVIEAIVESNCGDFEQAFEKMLEISATPRSQQRY